MTELKPCPFCGNKPRIKNGVNSEDKPYFQVIHDCPNLWNMMDTFCYATEKAAIERWNTRTPDINLSPDRLQEICAAEAEGRLVVLPDIRKNKTLYWIWGNEIMPVLYKGIIGGIVTKDGVFHVNHKMVTKKDRSFPYTYRGKSGVNTYRKGDERYFYTENLGKTVFLSREQAEAALKEETP